MLVSLHQILHTTHKMTTRPKEKYITFPPKMAAIFRRTSKTVWVHGETLFIVGDVLILNFKRYKIIGKAVPCDNKIDNSAASIN